MPSIAAALLLIVQQVPTGTGLTSPAAGDTTGYWQQRADYRITATLDERAQRLRARGELTYVNNSPDTLREMYVHQYLNAFRPHSRWSKSDDAHGIVRFQNLKEPDYAYARFTAPVRVGGVAVVVEYPGAPDSTVARFTLPAPLLPGDSVVVAFEWDARPSTLPRRQGRRGRSWDFAQWYPKVAVYDRGGWEHNPLQIAGEFYGEFGDFDVTLVLPADQVVGATGVPVAGDPGWSRVRRIAPNAQDMRLASNAYGAVEPPEEEPAVPEGFRSVRFVARDVHHFAWSTSPEYRYEGTTYVRNLPPTRWPTWDTVSIHVLYRPPDDTTWGRGIVAERTVNTIRWLESIFGPYAYPQMTVLHRIEGGGTEFPMVQMNGSPSQGLNLHEGGHIWTYGILANNEWRSGWLDEGFTSYQSEWAQALTPQERLARGITDRFREPQGYRALGTAMLISRADAINLSGALTDIQGGAEPIGTTAHEFRDFGTYNQMIYSRAQVMYSQLRDELGDSAWQAFLADYYARWALRHVDERAIRGSAERAAGRPMDWFFRQWVHETGVLDYALEDVRRSTGSGGWITEATVRRRGGYSHSMPVGVRTRSGWTIARLPDPTAEVQTVRIVTGQEPLEVRLDPHHFTWDWDRRNDTQGNRPAVNVDWPFLTQSHRERSLLLWRPTAWYSNPGGGTFGIRARTSYLEDLDQVQVGVAAPVRGELPAKLQGWARVTNPYFGFMSRPAYGFSAGAALLDDVVKADLGWRRDREVAKRQFQDSWTVTYADPVDDVLLPEMWDQGLTVDLAGHRRVRTNHIEGNGYRFTELRAVAGRSSGQTYGKAEIALGNVMPLGGASTFGLRAYLAGAMDLPAQRALLLSAVDPVEAFENHWWRPRGAILKQPNVNWLPLGGPALRGYRWDVFTQGAAALNADWTVRALSVRRPSHELSVFLSAFTDAALTTVDVPVLPGPLTDRADGFLMDAGLGLVLRGRVFDRPFRVRIDSPFYVSEPILAIDGGRAGRGEFAPRWALSFTDIW